MSKKPLDVLKNGLAKLEEQVKAWKNDILDCLANKQPVCDDDEHWLDNEANLVEEVMILDLLDQASDYERGVKHLNSQQKSLVEKLKGLGSGIKNLVSSKKRKRPEVRIKKPQEDKQPKAPVFIKKENATMKQKVEIMDWHPAQGPKFKQGKTAEHWNQIYPNLRLKQPTISAWLKACSGFLSLLNTADESGASSYLTAAEKEVSDSLSHLQRLGMLQSQNTMAINELVDFTLERVLYDDGSEEDIFNAIKECQNAEQDKEMNGGDDGGDGDVVDEKPSWKEALAAASILQRYVVDTDEPFARKLETVLTNFGRQTRLEVFDCMEMTSITDYFPSQSSPYL
ncbi:hypothetical protein IW261DRAFT_1421279 [Armillaria novae-zelandiae]|uniref:Uncharacterized protein n=1 Tax=Armillaria novae-zelandiae TaxID=153914 RepID=A0AA39UCC1_9AGAR|nr:hypothetical protein IW261DRAFT_1421279 [Armillaria novae-zelandiae]